MSCIEFQEESKHQNVIYELYYVLIGRYLDINKLEAVS